MSGGEKGKTWKPKSEMNVEHKEKFEKWLAKCLSIKRLWIIDNALATQSPPKKAKTAKRGEITAEKVKEDWAISPILCPSTDVTRN